MRALERGLAYKIFANLPVEEFIPAPAQGALAVQIRCDDSELVELRGQLDDGQSRIAVETERAVPAAMQGECKKAGYRIARCKWQVNSQPNQNA